MEISPIAEGEIITEPGIYEVPISWYHDQCTDGPSISSSGLRKLFQSPAHFWLESELNPNRVDPGEKQHFSLGRAAHHLLLGEGEFAKHFAIRPSKWDSWRTNDAKLWRDGMVEAGFTVLTPDDIETVRGMAGLLPWQKGMDYCGLANAPEFVRNALGGQIETSLIWKDEDTGIWLKSRPDAIPTDSGIFVDLKTTTEVDDHSLANTVLSFGYQVQAALAGMAAAKVLGVEMTDFAFVFIEKKPPYSVTIKVLSENDIIRGEHQVFAGLRIFKRCLETGVWPGPTAGQADAQRLSLPDWGRKAIDARLEQLEREYP